MTEPHWLLADAVVAVHRMLIAEHGGIDGIRDQGLLESALARPVNKFHYSGESSLAALAAAYAFGIARNHPFSDGNKRTALVAIAMFLGDNGQVFAPDRMEALTTTVRLAAGEVAEEELGAWIGANMKEKGKAEKPPTRSRGRGSGR